MRNLITVFTDVMSYILVQLLTIPTTFLLTFHTYLEVGASRLLPNVGDQPSYYTAPRLKSSRTLSQVMK